MAITFVGRRVGSWLPVSRKPLRLPLWLSLLWLLLIKIPIWIVLLVARSPVVLTVCSFLVVTLAAYRLAGLLMVAGVYLAILGAFLGIRFRSPEFYERRVALLIRSRWRRSMYAAKWSPTMDFAELVGRRDTGARYEPVLLSVSSNRCVDRVRVRMLAGQVVEDWGKAADRLCQTFGAHDCRVRSVPGRPHEVELWFLISDPLGAVVEPQQDQVPVDLAALPVGKREDGEIYKLPLLGSHVLLVGATGAGKSSVIWSVIDQLAPAIADGTVKCWGIDPKGMELSAGAALFDRLAYADPSEFADLLEDAVLAMRERQAALRGITRVHQPTKAEPLIVVLVDELAALSYVNDRDVRRRIDNALGLLLSQGRAVGVSVVGAVQDPRKEVLPSRDLFPVRVCLRVVEADQVRLVLGPGARDRGARADEISYSLPGVGFVQVDGIAEPVRVRFAYVDNDQIRTLAEGWAPARSPLFFEVIQGGGEAA